ncbi:TnsA-like heteromeric transposase endonuclease subunit [Streptomyces sp. SP2-10]|uniref:TnsA-like heteromeric transposase endonuclease subunit n=1 Tax=Streptomyces sp. SP2-10 TaxID=2873385 RepID=UPI0027E0BD5B|nr:TnsA-like heteromeric transposase endonuclease subunit [Streptomyces sp. SP2-10]
MNARFTDPSGSEHEVPWLEAAGERALEKCLPVRLFPALKGRRWAPGWYWSATDERLVHYGSKAMRTQVMMLDRDPRVVALACRPVELLWRGRGGKVVVHAPHLMARLADGTGLLVDCAGRLGAGRRLVSRAMHVEAAATAAGWHYRLVGPPPPVVEANVRWLSGYRHPRCAGAWLPAVAAAFTVPRALIDGVRLLGDPIAVWPVVFHALWSGVLTAPMDRVLSERVIAVAPQAGAAR